VRASRDRRLADEDLVRSADRRAIHETGSGSDLFVYDMVIFGPQIGLAFHF